MEGPRNQDAERCTISPTGVRPFIDGDEWMTLATKAAMCGFWDLDRVALDMIAKVLNIRTTGDSDLHSLLWIMVKAITKLPDERIQPILFERLASMETTH